MPTSQHRGALGYIRGLLARVERANCVRIAERSGLCHDTLSRTISLALLETESWMKTVLFALRGMSRAGSIIIDDTTINKEFAKRIEGCSWVWSSAHERVLYGYSLVVLAWSDGITTVPITWRVYKKGSGKTKVDIAVELLSYAKITLNIKPDFVLFDAFYAADKIIKRCEEYGWKYLGRVKRNRLLDGVRVARLRKHPYWNETGVLSCGERARIVRDGKRYFITNEFDSTRKEIVTLYGDRWPIEEVFRVLHSELGIDECQSRSLIAQTNHCGLCMLGYAVLASEQTRTGQTEYALRHGFKMMPSLADSAVSAAFLVDA